MRENKYILPTVSYSRRSVFWTMGRTKRGNANAQRNKNKKREQRTSEELVEFTTGSKERQATETID